MPKCLIHKLTDGVALARGQDEVVGGVALQHHPHASDVVTGVTPVALGVQIAFERRNGVAEGRICSLHRGKVPIWCHG